MHASAATVARRVHAAARFMSVQRVHGPKTSTRLLSKWITKRNHWLILCIVILTRGNTMTNQLVSTRELVIDGGALALHVLKSMTRSHKQATRCTLDNLAADLRVRRADLRSVLSALHTEGMVDITTMRLTLSGFAVGCSLLKCQLAPLRMRLKPLVKTTAAA
jgi:hypothetical protein